MKSRRTTIIVLMLFLQLSIYFFAGFSTNNPNSDYRNELLPSSLEENELINIILDKKLELFDTEGYFPHVYEPSIQATYYVLEILDSIDMLDEINTSQITEYIMSFYNSDEGIFVDNYAKRWLDIDLHKELIYPLSSLLEINCYAVLSFEILDNLDRIDTSKILDFVWDCYHPVDHAFLGMPFDIFHPYFLKLPTMDNTYYAIKVIDLLDNWDLHIQIKNDIIAYITSLQSSISNPDYFGGFFNDKDFMIDSLELFEPNLLSSYYCLRSLELFDKIDAININNFHVYLNNLYNSKENYFYFSSYYKGNNWLNLVGSALGLELANITSFSGYLKSNVSEFIFDNRNALGIWDQSTSVQNHELIDSFQVIRSVKNLNLTSQLNTTDKALIVSAIDKYFNLGGYSLLSEDYTSLELLNTLVLSFNLSQRLSELPISQIYSLIESSCIYDLSEEGDKFISCANIDTEWTQFRSFPIEYYSFGKQNYIFDLERMVSQKITFLAMNILDVISGFISFEEDHDLLNIINRIIGSQFLDVNYSNYGGFLPTYSFNLFSTPDYRNYSINFENSYYAIQSLKILNDYLQLGNISNIGFNIDALITYIHGQIIETSDELYFSQDDIQNIELILENTYYGVYILKLLNLYTLNSIKIKRFIENNLNYNNLKNIYYSYKISELLNLDMNFNTHKIQRLVLEIYDSQLYEFYISNNKKNLYLKALYWICEMEAFLLNNSAPSIIINNPKEESSWNSPPILNVRVLDPCLDSIWYQVGSNKRELINNTDQIFDLNVWNSLSQGPFVIQFYANDSYGFLNDSVQITLNKDTLTPAINPLLPYNNSYYSGAPEIQMVVNDANFDSVWYTVGTTKVLLENGVSELLSPNIWNSLPQGQFQLDVFANDTAGNLNNSYSFRLHKDTIMPNVTIFSPYNNTYYNINPEIHVFVNDINFDTLWYTVGAKKVILTNGIAEPLDSTIWDDISQGEFILSIFANDTLGNVNNLYSFILYKDTIVPKVDVISPYNNAYYSTAPEIHVFVGDVNFDTVWYTVGTTKVFLENGVSELLSPNVWNNLPQGQFQLDIFANDTAGNLNNSYSFMLYKDTVIPDVNILLPYNHTYYNTPPGIHIFVNDVNFDSAWYTVGANKVLLENGVSELLDSLIWNTLPQGEFILHIYANDTVGNVNDENYLILYKDTVIPDITIFSPYNNTYCSTAPEIHVLANDTNFDSLWYTVETYMIFLENGVSEPLDEFLWNIIPQGEFILSIFANDTLGNINSLYSFILYKDTIVPEVDVISPYNNAYYSAAPEIQAFVDDVNFDTVWYTIGVDKIIVENGISELLDSAIWNALPQGEFIINIFANDSAGNLNNSYSYMLYKDTVIPTISSLLPYNNTYYNEPPWIYLVADDINLDSLWYTIKDTKVILENSFSKPLNATLWNNLPQGQFIINVFTNDTAGNLNNRYHFVLYKDTIIPDITIFLPYNNTYYNTTSKIHIFVNDTNFDSIWYTIGTLKILLKNNISELLSASIWNYFFQGECILYIFANDSAGNINDRYLLILYNDQSIIKTSNNFSDALILGSVLISVPGCTVIITSRKLKKSSSRRKKVSKN